MPRRAPRFEAVGGGGGGGGGADPEAAERRVERGNVPDVDDGDPDRVEAVELEPGSAPAGPRFSRSQVIAPQNTPVQSASDRAEEQRDLSPTSELIAREGAAEDLERGEQAIEERAAEGDVFAQTFEGGSAIQEAGAAAAEELRAVDDPTPGDVASRATAIGVGGAGFAAGLPGQAVGAAGVAGTEGAERVLTDETVESIGFGGSRQSRAIAEEPVASGVALAAPSAAVRGARAGGPRIRAGAETLATEFTRGGRSRGQLQIGRQTGRQEGATVREITAEDIANQRATADIRGPTERLVPGARGQDLAAPSGFQVARFGDPVTSGRAGGATGARVPVEGALASGADARREQAQQPAVDIDAALETDAEQTQPRSEPVQREVEAQALDQQARERQVSIEAAAEDSLAGLDSRERSRARERDRAATATTAGIAERAAVAERTTGTTTESTATAGEATPEPPQMPRGIVGDGDDGGDDEDASRFFDLIGQENVFPARDPLTGAAEVLEEAGFE